MKWRCFSNDPPYDAYEDYKSGLCETDFVWAYFIYKYKDRPYITKKDNYFLSNKACMFSQGVFEGYEKQMSCSSVYPMDHIEVLFWVENGEAKRYLKADFMAQDELKIINNKNFREANKLVHDAEKKLQDIGLSLTVSRNWIHAWSSYAGDGTY